jgi:hypothetical protein
MILSMASFTALGDPGIVNTTVCDINPPTVRDKIVADPISA